MAWNLEDLIRWEELSDSLQRKFRNLQSLIKNRVSYFDGFTQQLRVTISYDAPKNPEPNRDIWWDLKFDVLKFYIGDNWYGGSYTTANWYMTRAAWYGGNAADPLIPYLDKNTALQQLKNMTWYSNIAKNGAYSASGEFPRTNSFVAPVTATYKVETRIELFPYNKQYNYEHDGGSLYVVLTKDTRNAGSFTATNLVTPVTYDSKINPSNQQNNGLYPSFNVNLKSGDRISVAVVTSRDPKSTDEVEITQLTNVAVYIDPTTKVYDDPVGATYTLNSKRTDSATYAGVIPDNKVLTYDPVVVSN